MLTSTTAFSGAGLMDIAINAAGFRTIQAVECDPKISPQFAANFPDVKLWEQRIETIDPDDLKPTHHVHGSPSCQRASGANVKGVESTDDDIKPALAFLRIVQSMHRRSGGTMPRYVTLENVWQYRNFEAFNLILDGLNALGYCTGYQLCDAADFGTPQHRKRLWLRAALPEYAPKGGQLDLFGGYELPRIEGTSRWVGWYEALEDLLPSLPDGQLAEWQLKRLPADIREDLLVIGENSKSNGKRWHQKDEPSFTLSTSGALKAVLVDSRNQRNTSLSAINQPSFTVVSSLEKGSTKAILLERAGARSDRSILQIDSTQPSFTLRALGHSGHWHQADALVRGCIKTLTPDALWRLQMYGSDFCYHWTTSSNAVRCRGIGNGVAYLNAFAVLESLLAS